MLSSLITAALASSALAAPPVVTILPAGTAAYKVSDDGTVVVGVTSTGAFRWTVQDGFKAIPGSGFVFADTIANDRPHAIAEPFGLNRFIEGRLIDESVAAAVAH